MHFYILTTNNWWENPIYNIAQIDYLGIAKKINARFLKALKTLKEKWKNKLY